MMYLSGPEICRVCQLSYLYIMFVEAKKHLKKHAAKWLQSLYKFRISFFMGYNFDCFMII